MFCGEVGIPPHKSLRSELGDLFSEGDGMDDADGDATMCMLAGAPAGHLCKKTHGFEIEGTMATFDHFKMRDVAIGIDDEAACHASFDALLIGFGWIFAVLVDVVH